MQAGSVGGITSSALRPALMLRLLAVIAVGYLGSAWIIFDPAAAEANFKWLAGDGATVAADVALGGLCCCASGWITLLSCGCKGNKTTNTSNGWVHRVVITGCQQLWMRRCCLIVVASTVAPTECCMPPVMGKAPDSVLLVFQQQFLQGCMVMIICMLTEHQPWWCCG